MKKGRSMPPRPSFLTARSEAEAEAGDHLVPVEALLVVRVAIFGLHIGVAADRLLDPAADADAVEILVQAEIVHARRLGVVQIVTGIGVAGLRVKKGGRADERSNPAA